MPSTKGQPDATLQADVASFVSSLGLASSDNGIGFNDADFRKTGPINAKHKPSKAEKTKEGDVRKGQTEEKNIRKRKRQPREQDKPGDVKIAKLKQGAHKNGLGDLQLEKLKQGAHEQEGHGTSYGKRNVIGSFKQARNQSVSTDFAKSNEVQQGHTQTQKENSKKFTKIWSLLKSGPWYEVAGSLLSSGQDKQKPIINGHEDWSTLLSKAKMKGEHLMELASVEFEKSRGKDSDMRWLMMARKTGTTADKVAALTVLLQDNPVANLKAFDALLGMVTSKGGKRHAVMGIDALKELFLTSLLPDRKLKYLSQQPLQAQWDTQEGERLLFFWYWEDCLKHRYEQFVNSLEEATKDKLPFLKEKAVKTIYELLKTKPELERRLLSVLVNKLGDPERKVASNAGYYLSCLLTSHPNMKMVVVDEVDSFLFRPHLGLRSKYQAVVFLNQIVLSNRGDGPKLAKRLIDIYFSLFEVLTAGGLDTRESKDGKQRKKTKSLDSQIQKQLITNAENAVEMDSRLLSALLTGVNRAFPFVAADEIDIIIQEHTPVLLRLVHSKSFNVGVQALMLLYQLLAKNHAISDRFYRALYAVLFSPGLTKSSKMEMFLGLIFKTIKSDLNAKRMAAFAKRLMQVALQGPAQFACGCLLLLSEVLKSRPTLWNAVTQPEDEDEETEHFYDIGEELPLTNSTILGSTNDAHHSSITEDPGKDHSVEDESSSESEDLKCKVPDIEEDDDSTSADEEIAIKKSATDVGSPSRAGTPKMEHPSTSLSSMDRWPRKGSYNARHREPSFSNADRACWWELSALSFHVHPSVSTMAKTLLSGASILYAGNPVRDLALGVFLDRFTEKKPKSRRKSSDWHGSSLSAPSKVSTPITLPIGMEFLQLSEKEIAPEDVVFHKFYTSRMNRKGSSKKKVKDSDEVIAGDADEDDYLGEDGDISEEDEIEDMLEQEEGMEMDSSDFSEEDNESDWKWAHEELDGSAQAADVLENREDDDEIVEGNEVEEHGVLLNANGKKQSHGNKLSKRANSKSISGTEHSKKSPFASFDDFSHLLDDKELDMATERNPSGSSKKVAEPKKKSRKRAK